MYPTNHKGQGEMSFTKRHMVAKSTAILSRIRAKKKAERKTKLERELAG